LKLTDGAFSGRIRTLAHRLNLEFEPVETPDKRSAESPDFTVYARDGGDMVPIGSAWKKESNRGREVTRFLSITLDDPSFPAPLNLAAFPEDHDPAQFRIVWNRPRQMREAA
jgi:uncharacterized protein (DUF736 family)